MPDEPATITIKLTPVPVEAQRDEAYVLLAYLARRLSRREVSLALGIKGDIVDERLRQRAELGALQAPIMAAKRREQP